MGLADFVGAADAGTQTGLSMPSQNPLGGFVRSMISAAKQKQESEAALGKTIATEGIKSLFSTGENIAKEGRMQGYKVEEENREQGSPLYQARTEAEQDLSALRKIEATGGLTQEKAATILSKMGLQEVSTMKRNAPDLWAKLNTAAVGAAAQPAQPGNPTANPNKNDLYARYGITKVNQ